MYQKFNISVNAAMIDFPCTECGECCRHVGTILSKTDIPDTPIGRLFRDFPYGVNEEGYCEMLIDGKCSVYENRPLVCNIKQMNKYFYNNSAEHYLNCALVCNFLIDKAGLDKKYRIDTAKLAKALVAN